MSCSRLQEERCRSINFCDFQTALLHNENAHLRTANCAKARFPT